MSCFVSFGKLNIYLIYIILAIIFNVLNNCFYGLNSNEVFKTIKIFTNSTLSIHILIRYLFNYLLIFIISLCYYIYEKFKIKKKKTKKLLLTNTNSSIELIHYNPEDNMITKKVIFINLLIHLLWYIEELCLIYFRNILKDIDFWMIELFFLALLNLKIFNLKIYKHQWLAIYISLVSSAFKVLSIIISFCDKNKYRKYEEGLPLLYRICPYYFFGFFLYLLFIFIRSSVNSGIQWLMEKKYKPLNQILMDHGFMGIVCSVICIAFSSSFSCNKFKTIKIKYNYNNYTISNYVCKVKINKSESESNNTYEYLENILDYFEKEHWKTNYKEEILTIIFGSLTFFFLHIFIY